MIFSKAASLNLHRLNIFPAIENTLSVGAKEACTARYFKATFNNSGKELHAHINGSVTENTIRRLIEKKRKQDANYSCDIADVFIGDGQQRDIDSCFQMFKVVQSLTDTADAMYIVTKDVIREFAADNVKYLELRSTPRGNDTTGMSKRDYVEAVIRGIQECNVDPELDIQVRFILALDRRQMGADMRDTVSLAQEYKQSTGGVVVGVDLSGDFRQGDCSEISEILQDAKSSGLKLALHIAEQRDSDADNEILLKLLPDRIGHGSYLHHNETLTKFVNSHRIPLEICLTSNIKTTIPSIEDHHLRFWHSRQHPYILCTDDKGVFCTTLSDEYKLAADWLKLSHDQLWDISYTAIGHTFLSDEGKSELRQKFDKIKTTLS